MASFNFNPMQVLGLIDKLSTVAGLLGHIDINKYKTELAAVWAIGGTMITALEVVISAVEKDGALLKGLLSKTPTAPTTPAVAPPKGA